MLKPAGILIQCYHQFLSYKGNRRLLLWAAYTLYFIAVPNYLRIGEACRTLGFRASPWLFPLFVTLFDRQFLLGAVLLFADAPFLRASSDYELIRTTRQRWYWSKVLYVVSASFLYFLGSWLYSLLLCVPYLGFIGDWGKVITLSSMNPQISNSYGLGWLTYCSVIPETFPAAKAFLLILSIACLEFILIAMMMFTVGLIFQGKSKILPSALGASYCLFPDILDMLGTVAQPKYFPARWLRVYELNLHRFSSSGNLSPLQALLILLLFCLFFVFLNAWLIKGRELRSESLDD